MSGVQLSNRRQRELVESLRGLSQETAAREGEVKNKHRGEARAIDDWRESERRRVTEHYEASLATLQKQFAEERERAFFDCETQGFQLYRREKSEEETARQNYEGLREELRERGEEDRAKAEEQFAAVKDQPSQARAQFEALCEPLAKRLESAEVDGRKLLARRKCALPSAKDAAPAIAPPPTSANDALSRLAHAVTAAEDALHDLRQQAAARFIEDGWPLLIGLFSLAALAWPAWSFLFPSIGWGIVAVVVIAAIVIAIALRAAVRPFAKKQTTLAAPNWLTACSRARTELGEALALAKSSSDAKSRQLAEQKQKAISAAEAHLAKSEADAQTRLQEQLARAQRANLSERRVLAETCDQQLAEAEARFPPQIERQQKAFREELVQVDQAHGKRLAENRAAFESAARRIAAQWRAGEQVFSEFHRALEDEHRQWFPPWREAAAAVRTSDAATASDGPAAIPFGVFEIPLEGKSNADGPPQQQVVKVPAFLSHPDSPSLLLEAEGEGRQAAIGAMQTVMLRMLSAWPAGKVRFTIVDPVGLGQSFSAFMHLADFDEKLVANRIWTEPNHISQRLADLTEHMENVIQKYLRNEFASIQEYNAHAGEVAEPFQVLVVANFPAGFTDEAAGRLLSIASSGGRCGVFVLASVDAKMRLPRNFDLADLEAKAYTLRWEEGRFRAIYPELADLPLALDSPPDDRTFTEIVRAVGKAAKETHRVEVPFERIAPPESEWWTGDSRTGLVAPLGRAGATKLQYLRLGTGVSQHVLMAGKTGSGKSTLLHATIASLAIQYSPSEVQFYLIDFKKGVEFKAYASLGLPHARVIAIESEREFGLSVLERLDAELRERGDLFRKRGVQDIRGYRDAEPGAVLPRILLVIDEFQEFFVSEDKIAQEAALLLDRLVRQGRAFGIHVLLGSQTLAGAYSLARSTLGQMAVRIALQCSDTDAHLILSEDNTAARLLSRPGEAIYNDANGMLEGNHPFQVVWLPDHEREFLLRKLGEKAQSESFAGKLEPPIVFEGNAAADPRGNPLLMDTLRNGPAPAKGDSRAQPAPIGWLGEPVAIKEPTGVRFSRQSGANLLIVGPQEEMALGLLSNCLIGLASQGKPDASARPASLPAFIIFDGARPEGSEAGFFRHLANHLPIELAICEPGSPDVKRYIAELAAEVDRRIAAPGESAPPLFLCVYNLSRFRELQKADEFSFKSFEEAGPPTGKQFATILREGPAAGVFTLAWCDSYNSLARWIDRQTMHDFGQRVLFPMSAADSSNLMDGPAASRLGAHRAILFEKDSGKTEKFRPYRLPGGEWLREASQALARLAQSPNESPNESPTESPTEAIS